jgi:hypothetical protein
VHHGKNLLRRARLALLDWTPESLSFFTDDTFSTTDPPMTYGLSSGPSLAIRPRAGLFA